MNNRFELSSAFIKNHPLQAVKVLEGLPLKVLSEYLEFIDIETGFNILKLIDSVLAVRCLEMMQVSRASEMMIRFPLEIAALYLRRMAKDHQQKIMTAMPAHVVKSVELNLRYPDGSAGALMNTQIFSLPQDIVVADALERVRKQPQHILYYLYVVDREDKLVGVLTLRELLQSDSGKMLSEVMNTEISSLPIQLSHKSILIHPGWQDYHSLPVVDQDGILVGAVGYRTLKALQKKSLQDQQPGHLSKTGQALGELYWLALSGLLKTSISVFQKTNGSLGTKTSRSERHEL